MDKIEKIIQHELSNNDGQGQLDIESVLSGVHTNIRRRSFIRKTVYSSPVVILLLLMVFVNIPVNNGEVVAPGDELLMAGWEDSWTESQALGADETYEQTLYEQSVDYLTDDQYYLYENESNELLSVNDYEAFLNYLEEV